MFILTKFNRMATPKFEMSQDMLDRISEFGINLSIFGTEEREKVDEFMCKGAYQDLAAAIQHLTPSKEAEIAKILDAFLPRTQKIELESQKEAEMFYASANSLDITPEKEAELQAKIDKEKKKKLKAMGLGDPKKVVEVVEDDKGVTVTTSFPNNLPEAPAVTHDLGTIEGLGEVSIAKLLEAGVHSAEAFAKLPYEEKQTILNPLVAAKFKT